MLTDLNSSDCPSELDCDVCIVGAGAAGLAVAVELSRRGRRVVLLEGGGSGLEQNSQDLHRGASVGQPFNNIHVGRYRVLGGSTTFWGGQVLPFDPIVFEHRPWISDAGWPFGRETLNPYYAQAYDLLGLKGVIHNDALVWERLGAAAPKLHEDLDLPLTRWVPTRNFARLFKADIDSSPNLALVVHANVTNFSFAESRNSAVHARTLEGKQITVRAGSTVLACGTLEIARLLLQPLASGAPAPWHNNHWIGRGFIDHLEADAGEVHILDHKAFHNIFDSIYLNGFKYYPRIRLKSVAQKREGLVDICGHFLFETRYTQHLENIKMFVRSLLDGRMPAQPWDLPAHALAVAKIALPLVLRYAKAHRSFKPTDAKVRLRLSSEQIPLATSAIRVTRERDPTGMGRVEVDWRIDGRELKSFAVFARRIRDALARLGLARVVIDPDLEANNPAFLTKISDAVHQMSTARMGSSASEGVVDSNLRVHGTRNVYVAGAAVFPTSGYANPTFTAVALGLRLSDHLAAAPT